VSLSGAIAVNKYVHTVDAVVGQQAVLRSDSDVTVDASSENYSQAIANGTIITRRKRGRLWPSAWPSRWAS